MPTNFLFKEDGSVILRIRILRRENGVNHELLSMRRYITGLHISKSDWEHYHELGTENAQNGYLSRHDKFAESITKLKEIRRQVDMEGLDMTKEKLDNILRNVLHAESVEAMRKKQEAEEHSCSPMRE